MSADPDLSSPDRDRVASRRWPTWPRKNTQQHIDARQSLVRQQQPDWQSVDEEVFDLGPHRDQLGQVVEQLTAHMVLPVSLVGPLPLTLGTYRVDENHGHLIEDGRATAEVYVPLAHTEGSLASSMQRGLAAVLDGGHLETFVLEDRMTRDSCLLFSTTEEAVECARWVAHNVHAMRQWLHDPANPLYGQVVGGVARLSRHARLWEVGTHVLGPACHVLYRYTTGEACGPNMITRNSFALNHEFLVPRLRSSTGMEPRRVLLESNMGGDKKPSAQYFVGGHGKTVVAGVSVTDDTLRRVLHTSASGRPWSTWVCTAAMRAACSPWRSRRRRRSPRCSRRRVRISAWWG